MVYAVGTVIEEFIGASSSMRFDVEEGIAYLFVHVSPDWLEDMKLGGEYDFSFGVVENTMFICAKWNGNDYSSMPFAPQLCIADWNVEMYEAGKGMPLNVILVNTQNGKIVGMDFMVLSNEFSNNFLRVSREIASKYNYYDVESHRKAISKVYNIYSTDNEIEKELQYKCHVE